MASQSLPPHKINDKIFSLAFDKAGKRSEWPTNLYKPLFLQGSVKGKALTLETKLFTLCQAQRAWAAKWSLAELFLPPFGAGEWTAPHRWSGGMVSPSHSNTPCPYSPYCICYLLQSSLLSFFLLQIPCLEEGM